MCINVTEGFLATCGSIYNVDLAKTRAILLDIEKRVIQENRSCNPLPAHLKHLQCGPMHPCSETFAPFIRYPNVTNVKYRNQGIGLLHSLRSHHRRMSEQQHSAITCPLSIVI